MKISIITPSIRLEMLEIVKKCLARQTLKDFEWIVGSPFEYKDAIWIKDPPKKPGDNYCLNKSWNECFKVAKGELIVSIVDGLWFPPNTLEVLWQHYQVDPMKCIGLIGHQYDQLENGKPEHLVWKDPRQKDNENFYQISPNDMEWCISSIPRQAIFDVGGIDEKFDQYAALSEKEINIRMSKLGYTFWLDQSCEYRAIKHDRLSTDWDEKYRQGVAYFQKCVQEIQTGRRLKLDYLGESNIITINGVSKKEPAT